MIAETNQSGQMLTEYVYLGDQLLSMIKPGEAVYYFHNDHLGTPQILTDASGSIAWKAVYTPFGGAVPSIQNVENPFRFPGQYYDSETGLHYNYFRYYNPQTGRYITPDPIGLEGGINLFLYVQGNPLVFSDVLGLLDDILPYEVPGLLSIFDPNFGTLTVYDPNYQKILAVYGASNATVNPCGDPCKVGSRGPAPEGIFPVQGPFKITDPSEKIMYGLYFWQIGAVGPGGSRLDIARKRGIGIHGAREPFWPTEGCIRLSDSDIIRLKELTLKRPLVQIMILGRSRSYP